MCVGEERRADLVTLGRGVVGRRVALDDHDHVVDASQTRADEEKTELPKSKRKEAKTTKKT